MMDFDLITSKNAIVPSQSTYKDKASGKSSIAWDTQTLEESLHPVNSNQQMT